MKNLKMIILGSGIAVFCLLLVYVVINNGIARRNHVNEGARKKALSHLVDHIVYHKITNDPFNSLLEQKDSALWLASQIYQVPEDQLSQILAVKQIGEVCIVEEKFWSVEEKSYYRYRASSKSSQVEKIEIFKLK